MGLDDVDLALVHRRERPPVVDAVARGIVAALIIDAREPDGGYHGLELLRTLYDDPHTTAARRGLQPERVLALIADGDVEAAFAFGRFGIAGVIEDHQRSELGVRVQRIGESQPGSAPGGAPMQAPTRPALLSPLPPGGRPIVAIGYRHAPETRAGLARYQATLREHGDGSSVFADVALLLELLEREGLSCRTQLAAKASVAHSGQFIGSLEFYRQLRRTRYRQIPDHPDKAIAMDAFVSVDEILHDVLHLLFLANRLRAGIVAESAYVSEELSIGWWQGIIHQRVFPEWFANRDILEINNDFVYSEAKQDTWEFWKRGNVFDQYAHYPWIPWILAQLPERPSYIGERADIDELFASFTDEPAAAFLHARVDELRIDVDFASYPPIPPAFQRRSRAV